MKHDIITDDNSQNVYSAGALKICRVMDGLYMPTCEDMLTVCQINIER